jgi:hypothetical protein
MLSRIWHEVDRNFERAEARLQTVLRQDVFEPLGFVVPNQPSGFMF